MAALPENDRIAGPFVATEGQTDFPADFPLIRQEGLRARLYRAGGSTILRPADGIAALAIGPVGFTCRLPAPCAAGDQVWIFSELAPERPRQHTPNGAVRTVTLEDDAVEFQAQLQERDRDARSAIRFPAGEAGLVLASEAERAGRMLAFDAAGGVVLIDAVQVLSTVGVFADDGAWGDSEDPLTHDDGPFA